MGNVSHDGHMHPLNSHWRGKCRKQMEATGEPVVDHRMAARARGAAALEERQREAEPEVAATHDAVQEEVQRREREARRLKQRRRMTLSEIRELGEALDSVEQTLQGYYAIDSLSVTLRLEGHKIEASYDGSEWSIEAL